MLTRDLSTAPPGRPAGRRGGPRGGRLGVALLLGALLLAGCGGSEVVDFGAAPGEDAPRTPADDGVDVFSVDPPEEVPPTGARLVPGGWSEAAAYIAAQAEDGRPTLVNLFASWCAPCRAEMPLLLEARDANPDIAFLGIDHLDRLEDGEAFVEELGIDFTTIHDIDGEVAFAIGGRGMPTTAVFDRDGQLVARYVGELGADSLDELLDQVR
ncbi:MAG: TlpA family protein disulfide reductase [Nitriliruptoraceae bacterium]